MFIDPPWKLLTAAAAIVVALTACGKMGTDNSPEAAEASLARGEHKKAVLQLKSHLEGKPDDAKARFVLGKALANSGEMVAALVELQKAHSLGHTPSKVVPELARAMLLTGKGSELIAQFAALELDSPEGSADLKVSLALAYGMYGNKQSSDKALDDALRFKADFVPARLLAARRAAAGGNVKAALAMLDDIIAEDRQRFEAHFLRGLIVGLGHADQETAMQSFEAALAANPRHVDSHGELIKTYLRRNDLEGARRQAAKLAQVAPQLPETSYYEALVSMMAGELDRARSSAQNLLKVAPNDTRSLQLAGLVEFKRGALQIARTHLGKALSMVPDSTPVRMLLARVHLQSGNGGEALAAIEPVLKRSDASAEALSIGGEANLQAGDIAAADALFKRALALEPSSARLKAMQAISRIGKGDSARGLDELQEAAAVDTGTYADMALIALRLKGNQPDAALQAIDALERKRPKSAMAHQLRGDVFTAQKKYNEARRSYNAALSIDKDYFPAVAGLASLDVAEGRFADGVDRYRKWLSTGGKDARAFIAIAELAPRAGGKPEDGLDAVNAAIAMEPTNIPARLALINLYMARNQSDRAVSAAQDAVARIPDNLQLLEALGRALSAAGDFNQAIANFRKIAAAAPKSPVPLIRIAEVHLKRKEWSAAEQILTQALGLDSEILTVQAALFEIQLMEKRWPKALAIAREVQKRYPTRPDGWSWEGQVAALQRNWLAAIGAFRVALQRSEAPDIAIRLFGALNASGSRAQADRFAADWIQRHPHDLTFANRLGDTALERGEFGAAEELYLRVIEKRPNHASALNNLAWVLLQQRKPGAAKYALRATQLLPDQIDFIDTLALALAADGKLEEALDMERKALAKAPDAHDLRLSLAQILIMAGDKPRARNELEKLAYLGDKFRRQHEVQALLKGLR